MSALAHLRELLDAANPGEWEAWELSRAELLEAQADDDFTWWRNADNGPHLESSWKRHGAPGGISKVVRHEDGTVGYTGCPGHFETSAANARLIAATVNALPALLDIAAAARAFATPIDEPCPDPECPGCKLNAAVARLDALTQTALPSPDSGSETSA